MRRIFSYQEAVAFIHAAHHSGQKNGLANTGLVLERLGNPQRRFPSLHVAGTNGKGSVCAFLHGALRCSGYRVGLYTSPYLTRYNERMRVNGSPIPDGRLAALVSEIAPHVEALRGVGVNPTEFEIGTALAFLYFHREAVDIAVVEVGLGGRLDPTNVLTPEVAAITSIGLDHTAILGDTLEAIAVEKAGIAKPGVPLVVTAQIPEAVREAIRERCAAVGAPLRLSPAAVDIPLGLPGAHQRQNAAVSLEMLRLLAEKGWNLPASAVAEGLRRARWPGRLEWVAGKPPLLLDGAHNPQGAESLLAYLRTLPRARTILLCGMMADKDCRAIAAAFSGIADACVAVAPSNPRSLDAETLARLLADCGLPARPAGSVGEALALARAQARPDGRVVAAGSLYLVGELRGLLPGLDDGLVLPE